MQTTKDIIEDNLQLKYKDYKIVYSPEMPGSFHCALTTEYSDGTKTIADVDHNKETVFWNDYYVAENIHLRKTIESAQKRLDELVSKERYYEETEEGAQ